ncbi:MAG: thiamine pyrophosphate-dependent enzyme [Brevinematales bacterium]
MPHVVNAVYNRIPMKLLVLDNHITAMTGHQPNPGRKVDAYAQSTPYVDIEKVGMEWVWKMWFGFRRMTRRNFERL